MKGLDLVTDALREIRVVGAVDPPSPEDAAFALGVANRILDSWQAQRAMVFDTVFARFTLTPALQPHTIGPASSSPTWTVTARPDTIDQLVLIDTTVTPEVRRPITGPISDEMWQSEPVQGVTGAWPLFAFYENAWPKASLYFWPVPTAALDVELLVRNWLTAITLAGDFSMPPGYQAALTLTMAEELTAPLGVPMPERLPLRAAQARAVIRSVNSSASQRITNDAAPAVNGAGSGSHFDIFTRTFVR